MKPRQPLTPAMMRTRYHERPTAPARSADPERLPPLGLDSVDQEDATAEWLAHISAGRIAVR